MAIRPWYPVVSQNCHRSWPWRVAPEFAHDTARRLGASAFAAIGWLVVSLLFSWYAQNFGSYNATYGSLGAVIGFMIWMWLSAMVVPIGAELDAEMEHQTARHTTTGAPKPPGARGAKMADTVGAAQD